MRGDDEQSGHLFSYLSPEQRVPADHPLRAIRTMTDEALRRLSPRFAAMYAETGRPSIPPEKLLRALLLQVLYTIRSERMLMEQLDYNLLFRWFVGLGMDDAVWVPTVFTKNRDRLLEGDIAKEFFARVLAQAKKRHLLSAEHFTVDGTLIEAWAGQKSFRAKEPMSEPPPPPDDLGNPTVDFHGEKRSNATHQSTTDPAARLFKKGKGKEAKLSYMGHVLMENRNGLVVDACVVPATGTGERDAAISLVAGLPSRRVTIGGDKAIRHPRLRRAPAAARGDAARRAQSEKPGARRTHHTAPRLRHQSAGPQTHRGSLWLDEDHRRHAEAPSSRRSPRELAVPLRRRGLQSGPHADVAGDSRQPRASTGTAAADRPRGSPDALRTEVVMNLVVFQQPAR